MNNPLSITDISLPIGDDTSSITYTTGTTYSGTYGGYPPVTSYPLGSYQVYDISFEDKLSAILLHKVIDGTFTIEEADKILKNLIWK